MKRKTIFLFDLDGTVTKKETLPIISGYFGIKEQIDKLTNESLLGNIPFVESFIRRVNILGKLPVEEISKILSQVELYERIQSFINNNKQNSCIVTGNLDCWIEGLKKHFNGVSFFCSEGIIKNNQVEKLSHILRKESVVQKFKSDGYKVIFIGEGNNDVEAMRLADISIASGLTHRPANGVFSVADYYIEDEIALCRLLNQLL